MTYYAQWESIDYDLGFDVDSEPGDEDYPGIEKPDETVNVEGGLTVIEDPKRPGYVFQGWTIPNAEGTEAIDQDLVYQDETDGKWYVDASKLPDYAGEDGRVELTARWTSVISVDVPSSVTFYADVVTQGNESREGLASSAFGQSKVQSQSEVDLRIVGLESKQVKGNGSTSLGASDILKKKDGSALPTTSDKLFSLYPATGELTEDDLKDPDATSASKPAGAVDFSLDDILLEKSFAADKFTIPAGDTLSLGYRLNLQETDTELDYDKLSALSEGTSASIANISYCFAADYGQEFWTTDNGRTIGLTEIKQAADILRAGEADSQYKTVYAQYRSYLDKAQTFYLRVYDKGISAEDRFSAIASGKYSVCEMQIIGIRQDTISGSNEKAGLTFGFKDLYGNRALSVNPGHFSGGWNACDMRSSYLRSTFFGSLGPEMRDSSTGIVPVVKRQQEYDNMTAQTSSSETVFIPSIYEVLGVGTHAYWNPAEQASGFQYQWFAKGGARYKGNTYARKSTTWLTRSAYYYDDVRKGAWGSLVIVSGGDISGENANVARGVMPCFAF